MKKILFLLLFTVASYGQAVFDEGIQIKNNTTDNTATKVNVQSTDGTINTISKTDLVNVIEVNDVPALPLTGVAGKIYVVKNLNKIYRWNGTFYQELAVTDISGLQAQIDLKENVANKQNSLVVDGSGTKYPTVDAVNAFKNSLGTAAYLNAGTNDGDLALLNRSPSGEPQIRFSGNGINVLSLKNTNDSGNAYSTLAFSEVGSDTNLPEKGAVGVGKADPLYLPWRSVYLESFANLDNDLLPIRLVQTTVQPGLGYRNFRRIDIAGSVNLPGDITFYSGSGAAYPNESPIFKIANDGVATAYGNYSNIISSGILRSDFTFSTSSASVNQKVSRFSSEYGVTKFWSLNDSSGAAVLDNIFTLNHTTGFVGIGTSAPTAKLTVSGIDAGSALDITNTTASTGRNMRIVSLNTGGLAIEDVTAGVARMTINSSGVADFQQIPTAPTATAGTNTTQIATTAFVQANARPYRVYTALLTQSGAFAPTATVLENTLGGTVVWSRNSVGAYLGTLANGFSSTLSKVRIFISGGAPSQNPTGFYNALPNDINSVQVNTRNTSGSLADSLMSAGATIEIRVYN